MQDTGFQGLATDLRLVSMQHGNSKTTGPRPSLDLKAWHLNDDTNKLIIVTHYGIRIVNIKTNRPFTHNPSTLITYLPQR